ncbi:MAG: hypothetical protein WA723_17275 [Pseudolabrys sp.]
MVLLYADCAFASGRHFGITHHEAGHAMNSKGKLERLKAYHEAGHAVVARTLGIAMFYVTTLPTEDMTAGGALTNSASWLARDADQATQLAAIEKDMKACLAGPHAQARYQPRKTKRIPNDWASDFKLAKSFATKAVLIRNGRGADIPIGEGTFEIVLGADDLAEIARLFHRIWNETEALVAKLWPAITLVAEELLTRRMLFEDEVDALIEGKRLTGGEPA